jgi:replicative DNA helicase
MKDTLRHVDLDTERIVLGQILSFDGAWQAYASAGLTAVDFYRAGHQRIAEAACAVDADSDPVTMLTVRTRLATIGRLDEAGGVGYLFGLSDGIMAPDPATVRWAVARLRTLRTSREATALAQSLIAADDLDPATLAAHASRIDELLTEDSTSGGTDAAAQVQALYDARAHERSLSLTVGIPSLDDTIDGLRAGEVCGVMARTSVGKTLFACHVVNTLAAAGAGVVFVSLEMAQAQIVERLARLKAGMTRHQLRWALDHGSFNADAYTNHYRTVDVVDTPGLSLSAIERIVRAIQRKRPVSAVVIDYLGLVGADNRQTTYDRTSSISRGLKDSAKRLRVVMLPLIQVSRQGGGDDGSQRLTLGAARDSGVIEEAVDYLVALRRLDRAVKLSDAERDRYRDCLFSEVIKNRHGAVSHRECGIRVNPNSLVLSEDAGLVIDDAIEAKLRRQEVRL